MSRYPWQNQGRKLTDYDIPRIGHRIGVGEDEIHALLDVETRGHGFNSSGVILLFESHVFYRQLPAAKRSRAQSMGLAHTSWKRAKAAGNYHNNYQRFLRAYEYDPQVALMSCSWGLGQIMGFNHKLAGYSSVKAMVSAFAASEANQLQGMINFISSNPKLLTALRRHQWETVALLYNGKGYADNQYHIRLAQRYAWWLRKPDTPWTPASAEMEEAAATPVIHAAAAAAQKITQARQSSVAQVAATGVALAGSQWFSSIPPQYWLLGIACFALAAGLWLYQSRHHAAGDDA